MSLLYPNFLIVGVMKAATTTLSDSLGTHPNIHIPPDEIHFFDKEDAYQKGINYYQSFFKPEPGEYRVGEKTPTYSYYQPSARRIAEFNPEMKLIWIFRNPILRAYSHYWYFIQNGQERYSFEKAIDLEPLRKHKNIGHTYLDRGIYICQIERFLQYFPRENMLFLLYEDFRENPSQAIKECLKFLELPANLNLNGHQNSRNITHLPRSVTLQWLAYTCFYQRFKPGYKIVKRLNIRRDRGYPPLSVETKLRLSRFYQPYNIRFAKITGLDISSWQ